MNTKLSGIDFTTDTLTGILVTLDALKGACVTSLQALELAGLLGITIKDV